MDNPKFEFTGSLKKNLFIMMGTGVVGLILAFVLYSENSHARFWSNILLNTYYFTGIGLFGLFVVAAGTLAYGGWHILARRIFLSLSSFSRIGGFLLLAILLLGFGGVHNLYDKVMHILHHGQHELKYTNKLIYYAPVFWIGRLVAYSLLWFAFSYIMNKFWARTDQTNPAVYKRSKLLSAAFIVMFALTESSVSWDMIMSLDPHWYSTLFGWYNFASYGCAAWAMTILLIIYLKNQGYLKQVNENHVHDLGKFLFGFSIFWTYLWFDQFMLQWYANIPEETSFWVHRFGEGYFKFTIFLALIVNFLFPLLFLIKRTAKRNFRLIAFGSILLIFGHYVDFFNYTFFESNKNLSVGHHGAENKEEHAALNSSNTALYASVEEHKDAHVVSDSKKEEGAMETTAATETAGEHHETAGHKEEGKEAAGANNEPHAGAGHHGGPVTNFASIGLVEVLIFIGFLGLFLYMFFNNLSKRPIVAENDPYLKESERITVTYA